MHAFLVRNDGILKVDEARYSAVKYFVCTEPYAINYSKRLNNSTTITNLRNNHLIYMLQGF